MLLTVLSIAGPRVMVWRRAYLELRADEDFRPFERFYDLTGMARQAARSTSITGIERGRFAAEELARTHASFRLDWNYGNAIHYAHVVMGRLALRSGDLETAKCHPLEAGRTPGSPQLNDYGPDMTLAEELLEMGESATVLAYFEECERFWMNRQNNRLEEWRAAGLQGCRPDFGRASGLGPA